MNTIPVVYPDLPPYAVCKSIFFKDEIDKIIEISKQIDVTTALLGNTKSISDVKVRESEVGWIYPNDEYRWLFDKMAWLIASVNSDKYQFDLSQFDAIQYTTYNTGGFYRWHIDSQGIRTLGPTHRKLGISVMLSDPIFDFTGGEFQIMPAGDPTLIDTILLNKGDVVVFPSYMPHQVTPVVTGTRNCLVCWAQGPKFK